MIDLHIGQGTVMGWFSCLALGREEEHEQCGATVTAFYSGKSENSKRWITPSQNTTKHRVTFRGGNIDS